MYQMQRIISKHQHTDGLIALFPQHQMSGDISYDFGPNQEHGTLSNVSSRYSDHSVTKGHYMNASGYDVKFASYNDIYSTALKNAFDGDAGALFISMKTDHAWGDVLFDRYAIRLAADANNQIEIYRPGAASTLYVRYKSDGNAKLMDFTGKVWTTMDWFTVGVMWDRLVNDEVTVWLDGIQKDSGVGLGTWAGDLAATLSVIGASVNDGSDCWEGGLGIVAIYNQVLSDDQMTWLSKP